MRYSAHLILLPLLLAACVGEDQVVNANDAASAVDASDAAAQDSSTSDTSPPGDSSASDATADASPADAAVEAEAGTPSTTCVDQTIVSGSPVHAGCNASQYAVTPGGKLAVGDYYNASNYGQPYCPIAYAIGSAHVYVDNGATFFRYLVIRKTTAGDPGTSSKGTYWVKSNDGSGPIELVEVCDLANMGKSRTGTLSIVGNDFTFTFPNPVGQEKWTKF